MGPEGAEWVVLFAMGCQATLCQGASRMRLMWMMGAAERRRVLFLQARPVTSLLTVSVVRQGVVARRQEEVRGYICWRGEDLCHGGISLKKAADRSAIFVFGLLKPPPPTPWFRMCGGV